MATQFVSARALIAWQSAVRECGVVGAMPLAIGRISSLDPSSRVPLSELQWLLQSAFDSSRDCIGLALARALPLESMGLWHYLLSSSPTLGAMFERAARHYRLVSPFPEIRLIPHGAFVSVGSACPPEPFCVPREHLVAATLCHWIVWGRQLTGVDFPVIEMQVRAAPPQDATPWRALVGSNMRFGAADDSFLLERKTLQLPLSGAAPELAADFERLAEREIDRLSRADTWPNAVERVLDEELAGGGPTMARVADKLHVTPRTLHRRLATDGTCFRDLRDRRLRRLAEAMILETDIGLQAIAYRLGYSDAAAFCRAFRRWTGMSPARWRSQAMAGGEAGPAESSPKTTSAVPISLSS